MQAFTDLVGTSAVPALSINIEELTELTPALETAAVDHGTSLEASEAAPTWPTITLLSHELLFCPGC